ncbi:hypothetical protein M9H77_17308 [Catharanthus roseus]|uniref:Uncharacterized protein n=1 Tax=Catharanthus roseus TaxID=4058 RepID=A0ACC0B487_CATRO|nr:hypothetical protein M9H77_17308 [Catharanthus roseus]
MVKLYFPGQICGTLQFPQIWNTERFGWSPASSRAPESCSHFWALIPLVGSNYYYNFLITITIIKDNTAESKNSPALVQKMLFFFLVCRFHAAYQRRRMCKDRQYKNRKESQNRKLTYRRSVRTSGENNNHEASSGGRAATHICEPCRGAGG